MENKYYDLVVELVKKHRKFSSVEDILDDIVTDVLERAKVVMSNITNQDVVETYLTKIVAISMITVPKKMDISTRACKVAPSIYNETPTVALQDDSLEKVNYAFDDIEKSSEEELCVEELQSIESTEEVDNEYSEEVTVDKTLVDKMINGIVSIPNDTIVDSNIIQEEIEEDGILLDEDIIVLNNEETDEIQGAEQDFIEESFDSEPEAVYEQEDNEGLAVVAEPEAVLLEEVEFDEFEGVTEDSQIPSLDVVEVEMSEEEETNIDFEPENIINLDETDVVAFQEDVEVQEDLNSIDLADVEQEETLEEIEEEFVPVNLADAISRVEVDELSEDLEETIVLEEDEQGDLSELGEITEFEENNSQESKTMMLQNEPNYSMFECQNLQRELDIDFVKST